MKSRVTLGIEALLDRPATIAGRRVAVLSHHAAVTHDLRRSVDVIAGVAELVRIFAPEHGFWALRQAEQGSETEIDSLTGKEIISLYAEHPMQPRELTPEGIRAWKSEIRRKKEALWPKVDHLVDIDCLVVDLQDIGTRYYTFATTMAYCMEVCKTTGTRVVVCDRPNPINGVSVEGNLFDDPRCFSFVGQFDIPPRHGLTIGELARFFSESDERYACELEVIPLKGWHRALWWDQTDLPWIPPSPNVPSIATATVYPGMCLIESTRASEGRGTTLPFEVFGTPNVDPYRLTQQLNKLRLPGVLFAPKYFLPMFQKQMGRVCGGAQLVVTDRDSFASYLTGLWCLKVLHDFWPDFEWRREAYEFEPPDEHPAVDQLVGSSRFRAIVENDDSLNEWINTWDLREYNARRDEVKMYVD
jgi:uncharacterized protein YbbC (DUF1343 family)